MIALTVIAMVSERLRANGSDGLVSENGECGCELDDLAPCGEMAEDCAAAKRAPCPGGDACDAGEGSDHFHMRLSGSAS
jgi:hypothetical protein